MYTWILVFLLCSWKIETLFLKWKDQKLQTMQLQQNGKKMKTKKNLYTTFPDTKYFHTSQGSHRLEKYLNLEGFLEKSLKIKCALKSTGKSLKCLEKSLNSSIFCRTF